MNSITFDGRLGRDASLEYTPSGEPVLKFVVASDIGYGERKVTNWFNCQLWGKRGESLKEFLQKGQQVTVYGQLTLREWETKEGEKRLSPDVRVSELSLQGGKREGGQGDTSQQHSPANVPPPQRRQAAPQQQAQEEDDQDVPF